MSLPDSPILNELSQLILQLEKQAKDYSGDTSRGITDALYLVVTKRISKRNYEPPLSAYLTQLIKDIESAEWEHSEVCYANDSAKNTFKQLKLFMVQKLARA